MKNSNANQNAKRNWSELLTGGCFGLLLGLVFGLMVKAAFGSQAMSWGGAMANGAIVGVVVGVRFPALARIAIWCFQSIFP